MNIILCQQIEKNELIEMRCVVAYIYKKAGTWKHAANCLVKERHLQRCIEIASQYGDRELTEKLLVYFIEHIGTIMVFDVVIGNIAIYAYVIILFR